MAQTERRREEAIDARARKRAERLQQARAPRTELTTANLPLPELIGMLQVILDAGGALRIGRTRDGGAWAFGLYGLGEPTTVYVGPNEDILEAFEQITEAYRD